MHGKDSIRVGQPWDLRQYAGSQSHSHRSRNPSLKSMRELHAIYLRGLQRTRAAKTRGLSNTFSNVSPCRSFRACTDEPQISRNEDSAASAPRGFLTSQFAGCHLQTAPLRCNLVPPNSINGLSRPRGGRELIPAARCPIRRPMQMLQSRCLDV